jgi:adenylosuccinate synthase
MCPITTPYDKFANMNSKETIKHGSCGVGYGKTIEREERLYSLLAGDLYYKQVFAHKLALISEYYKDENAKYECEFLEACEEMLTFPGLQIVRRSDYSANTVIYEGSQGLLLDKNIGFFPHVTRGNVDLTNVRKLHGISNPDVMFVTRCYQTRHGNGPMTNEGIPHNIVRDPKETNVTHQYQGGFRITMLDFDLLEYAISRIGEMRCYDIAVTCLEHVPDEVYHFTRRGQICTVHGALELRTAFMNTFQRAEHVIMFKNHQKMEM